jgi:hypothetical protein
LCNRRIYAPWGTRIRLFARQFNHIVSDSTKGKKTREFSLERASHLPYLLPLLTSDSTRWHVSFEHHRRLGDVVSEGRMIGNIPGTVFVAVVEKLSNGNEIGLVTAYPADRSINKVRNNPIILDPNAYLNRKFNPKYR